MKEASSMGGITKSSIFCLACFDLECLGKSSIQILQKVNRALSHTKTCLTKGRGFCYPARCHCGVIKMVDCWHFQKVYGRVLRAAVQFDHVTLFFFNILWCTVELTLLRVFWLRLCSQCCHMLVLMLFIWMWHFCHWLSRFWFHHHLYREWLWF